MHIVICNERFLFRFGLDRALILLGKHLRAQGNKITVLANRYDKEVLSSFADQIVDIPTSDADYYNLNEFTADWLKKNWNNIFPKQLPDLVFIGGWPFFTAIKNFNELNISTVFFDCGAVPMDKFEGGGLAIQQKVRKLRKENLKYLSHIISISDFIANTQSRLDTNGLVPITTIYLGVDHLDESVWVNEKREKTTFDLKIKKLRNKFDGLIFNLGRWEAENYKNSNASLRILRRLRNQGVNCCLIILDKSENINIPLDLKEVVVPIGFPDDEELLVLMQEVDIGLSVSKWEGFNFPLAEMQWIKKTVFVFNIGAHPEVVVHPWFLCADELEMTKKVFNFFTAKRLDKDIHLKSLAKFKANFPWKNQLLKYEQLLNIIIEDRRNRINNDKENKLKIIIDVSNAAIDSANSGVIRVTRRLSKELQNFANLTFVLWDNVNEAYVYPTKRESEILQTYNGPSVDVSHPISIEGSRLKLEESIIHSAKNFDWLLIPEITKEQIFRKKRIFADIYNLKTASIFYDAIPILHPELVKNDDIRDNHAAYMKGLSKVDVVVSVSNYSAKCLIDFWEGHNVSPNNVFTNQLPGEFKVNSYNTNKKLLPNGQANKIRILCVSTLEPRKNHLNLIQAVIKLKERKPNLPLELNLIGNKYAGAFELAEQIEDFSKKYDYINWLGVVDDDELKFQYENCYFTVYPSITEGFGMPILESIWHGKPCLCSHKGVMNELAVKGGCLTVDILQIDEIASGIDQLVSSKKKYEKLVSECENRKLKTWKLYTEKFINILEKPLIKELKKKKKILICSNVYPPNFIGGAELIAHNQAKAFKKQGHEVLVFAGEVKDNLKRYEFIETTYEGLKVFRTKLMPDDFDSKKSNFYNTVIDALFDKVMTEHRPDVVHFHNMIGLSLNMASIAKSYHAKVFLTPHDHWGFCLKNTILKQGTEICSDFNKCSECQSTFTFNNLELPIRIRKDIFSYLLNQIDFYTPPSSYLAKAYIKSGIDSRKVKVNWYGMDVGKYSQVKKIKDDAIRFSFIGYIGEHKGVEVLIDALNYIPTKYNWKLNIVGEGHLSTSLIEKVKNTKHFDSVKFWGKIKNEDISKVYEVTDVLILPSIWPENQPLTIAEAMNASIPVIASNIGGIPELINHGVNGFLFEPNSPEDLALKMLWFLDDPKKLSSLGNNAQKKMSANTYSLRVKALDALYDKPLPIFRNEEHPKTVVLSFKNNIISYLQDTFKLIDDAHFSFGVRFVPQVFYKSPVNTFVFWVIDFDATIEDCSYAIEQNIPLLVPEHNQELKDYCIEHNCGLYYNTSYEALVCLEYLINKNNIYNGLAGNVKEEMLNEIEQVF